MIAATTLVIMFFNSCGIDRCGRGNSSAMHPLAEPCFRTPPGLGTNQAAAHADQAAVMTPPTNLSALSRTAAYLCGSAESHPSLPGAPTTSLVGTRQRNEDEQPVDYRGARAADPRYCGTSPG